MSWKTPITLLVLLVLLLGGAFYGWQTIISPATEGDANTVVQQPKNKCADVRQFHRGQVIRADDVVVNVYNAGSIANLAEDTLSDLRQRGFKAGAFDNAPGRVSATNVTILTVGKVTPQIRLVAKQFKGAVRFSKGSAIDPGINVIVGDDFKGIDRAAKTALRLKRDVSTCTSVARASG